MLGCVLRFAPPPAPMSRSEDVTRILTAIRRGEADSGDLLPLVYDELRALAQHQLGRLAPGQTLQATALVHETYLKLLGAETHFEDRRHFFGSCARAMRNILVDAARARDREKRGAGWHRVTIGEALSSMQAPPVDLLALDEALDKLERIDPRQHEIVLLRYFSGLSIEETARALGVSSVTVTRRWRFARAWLLREISRERA